ncbi:MerR family transcriptional regulator [Paenibacillus pabuli]|uniref:MerR family transcriptional regulator n=1 Tax=Paenibacillus pabuli TaxID=1472 RepID=UPI003459F123
MSEYFKLPPETIRYWESMKILSSIQRNDSGYREYTQQDIDWIRYVKCLREIGVPIERIQEYTALSLEGDSTLEKRKEILEEQRAQLIEKSKELDQALELANYKIENYATLLSPSKKNKN